MNLSDYDKNVLERLLDRYGADAVETAIKARAANHQSELTIVANGGLHPIPSDFVFGRLYIASEGNLDFSNIDAVSIEIDSILRNLRKVLKSERWTKIYLIPFGHAVISMNIKMAVYRTLRIETSDIFYFGEGRYGVLEKDTRRIMLI